MHQEIAENAILISGSSHQILAQQITNIIKFPFFQIDQLNITNSNLLANKHVFILQTGKGTDTTSINQFLLELLGLLKLAKRNGASRITAIIPCFPYARQDKKEPFVREPITAKLVAKMLEKSGTTDLICVELHSAQIQGFFEIPVNMLTVDSYLAHYITSWVIERRTEDEFVIVSPDVGGVNRAIALGELLKLPVAVIYKERGIANQISRMLLVGEVRGKMAIIVDDMVDTCGTLVHAARTLVRENGAIGVYAIAVHGIFSGDAVKMIEEAPIDLVVVGNTVPIYASSTKIQTFSIASLIAGAILQSCEHKISQSTQ